MSRLVKSESSFKYTKHSLSYVYGLTGHNYRVWKDTCPFSDKARRDNKANIWAGAWILRYYLDSSGDNYLLALTKYKGYSSLGKRQAKMVLKNI